MAAAFPLFPEQASTAASRVDGLTAFLLSVSTFFTLVIAAMIAYYAVRYRRRPGGAPPPHVEGSTLLETIWTVIPLLIGLGMFAWGVEVYLFIIRPPEGAMEVYVVAKQWMWKIQHPEGQREINELHVPVDQPVKLRLISEDVIHDFFVPAFRVKVDVLPNRYVETWFQATKTGRYHLFCSQYCGVNHSGMTGTVVVMKPEDYQAWLTGHAEGSIALDGRKLFLKYQCVSCHSADALARAPVLEDLFGHAVPLQDGRTVVADEAYLRKSIIDPDADITAGYEPIMPSFQGQISEEEILKLIAFIKSLQPGQTPKRIDASAPPEAPPKAKPSPRPAAGSRQSAAGSRFTELSTVHCALHTSRWPLPTGHCSLPTARCPLPTAWCPLPG
jgi:cytochrome c oxidase subunit 2